METRSFDDMCELVLNECFVFPIYEMDISYVLYMFLHVPSFGGAPFQILKPKQKQIFFLNSLGGPGIGDAAYTTKYRLFVGNVLA